MKEGLEDVDRRESCVYVGLEYIVVEASDGGNAIRAWNWSTLDTARWELVVFLIVVLYHDWHAKC